MKIQLIGNADDLLENKQVICFVNGVQCPVNMNLVGSMFEMSFDVLNIDIDPPQPPAAPELLAPSPVTLKKRAAQRPRNGREKISRPRRWGTVSDSNSVLFTNFERASIISAREKFDGIRDFADAVGLTNSKAYNMLKNLNKPITMEFKAHVMRRVSSL